MSVTLGKTDLKEYDLHLSDGAAVVRNPMLKALINAKLQGVSKASKNLLATPVFSGSSSINETIQWQTDQFTSDPRPLSELTGEERQRYEDILHRAFNEYSTGLSRSNMGLKDMLEKAVSYHSEDKVFCGDGKVVITEWGMHPKGAHNYSHINVSFTLPENSFEDFKGGNQDENTPNDNTPNPDADTPSENNTPEENQNTPEQTPSNPSAEETPSDSTIVDEVPQTPSTPSTPSDEADVPNPPAEDVNSPRDNTIIDNGGNNHGPINNPPVENPPVVNPPSGGGNNGGNNNGGATVVPPVVPPTAGGNNGGGGGNGYADGRRRKKPWWKWLLWLLLALLALILLIGALRSCGNSDPMRSVLPVSPEINPDEDISWSEDSLNMEVNNRLILLVAHGGTVSEFVKDFRKKYPDTKKYILSSPDTIIPRIILNLPKEEKAAMKERIPSEFPAWDIVVIPDAIYSSESKTVNDPALSDSKKRWYFDMVDVFDAWDVTMGDKELVVAVIDDGFDLNHPELKGKVVMPYNAVTHDGNVFPSKSGHGTHVAATIVGTADNHEGTAGIAPNCKLMPIQVAHANGVLSSAAILDGVLYAIYNGADVVNMSLGMQFNPMLAFAPVSYQKNLRANTYLEEEKVWNKIFELAEERNVSFVLAGGNQTVLIGLDPMQRSPKTIKVSAVTPDKSMAHFSNYGDYSVLSAPGVDIYNAVPGNKYEFMDGTSMASPIVAGGVALLKSNDPSLSTGEITRILRETGIPSPSDVGPIVNFGRALNGGYTPGAPTDDDCDKWQRRYNELLMELEQLKREHPMCVAPPDTLKIPVDATLSDFRGTWRSTTPLYSTDDQEVIIYFTFNGSANGSMKYVESSGATYVSPLSVRVEDNKIYMSQLEDAVSPSAPGSYNRYNFVLTPDRNRKATGRGQNLTDAANVINFQLIRLNM